MLIHLLVLCMVPSDCMVVTKQKHEKCCGVLVSWLGQYGLCRSHVIPVARGGAQPWCYLGELAALSSGCLCDCT
jgi:hypothetical protein